MLYATKGWEFQQKLLCWAYLTLYNSVTTSRLYHLAIMCCKKVETFEKKTNKKQTKTNKQSNKKYLPLRRWLLRWSTFFIWKNKETLPYFTPHLFFLENSISGYSDKERMFLISWTYKCTLHHIFVFYLRSSWNLLFQTFVKLLTTYSKLVSFHIFYEHRDDKEKKSQELTSYELLI